MSTSYKNRLLCTVSAVASAGLGAFTVSTASSGYVTFAAGDDAKVFDIVAVEGTAWEVRTGCTYTHSGTSLSRGTLESSSTGSAIAFTAAAILTVTPSAAKFAALELAMQGVTPGGRLTLESGVPVSRTDQTAKTTIYWTPYLHNICPLWDGVNWLPVVFAETSHALGTVTSAANYDVFAYLSGGSLALEKLAWTNDTTRATAVTIQDGRYCKSGDKTRLYLGTFRSTSTTQTVDTQSQRMVWNNYNRVPRGVRVTESTVSWAYASATIRYANGNSANRIDFVRGLAGDSDEIHLAMFFTGSSTMVPVSGVGFDDSTSRIGSGANGTGFGVHVRANTSGADSPYITLHEYTPPAGFHFYAWVESVFNPSGGGITFVGNNECGLVGVMNT